jgi:hypothetical protein
MCKKINLIWLNTNRLYIPPQAALAKDFKSLKPKPFTSNTFSLKSKIQNPKSKICNPLKSLFLAVYSHFYKKLFSRNNFVAIKKHLYLSLNKIQKKLS